MAKPKLRSFMEAIFKPLTEVANLPQHLPILKTVDLPEAIIKHQYSQFKNLSISQNDILLLGSSKFVVKFHCGDNRYLALNVEALSADERSTMSDFMISEGLIACGLEESFFLFLKYYLGSNYNLRREFRNLTAARNIIDIINESYKGHQIYDIIDCYDVIAVYQIPKDNVYNDSDIWYAACRAASAIKPFRSPLIDNALSVKIGTLSEIKHIPNDNIYVALTAIHWKYIFFELYKCLEKVFYLPWHISLKQEISCQISAANLAKLCRLKIEWQTKEANSIRKLFEMAEDQVFGVDLKDNNAFKDIKIEPASKPIYGRRIYKIRNILVHQQDYEDPAPLSIDDHDYEKVVNFMCDLLQHIYTKYDKEIEI